MGFVAALRVAPVALLVGVASAPATAAEGDFSPEALLFAEVPVVVSATRTERSLRDVPSAVTVVTAEEIRASGATELAELLQTVPGLDLMRVSTGDLNVSARGFNQSSSSTLLVMIDGRSAYVDFFGVIGWDRLNVTLQDIERIEVIRGPGGSALYGANAFLGTINIVTKRVRDMPGVWLQTGVGPDTNLVTGTVARQHGPAAVKASFRYRQEDHFRNELNSAINVVGRDRHDTGLRSQLGNAAFEYEFEDGSELRVSGGSSRLAAGILTGVGTWDYEGPEYFAQVDLESGPWTLKSFFTRLDLDLTAIPTGLPVPPVPIEERIVSNTFDVELQRELAWGSHDFLLGGNTRLLSTSSPVVLGARESDALYALFAQDEYAINDALTSVVSLRADRIPNSGTQLSPRASLIAKLGETDRLRFSFARSFRTPTQIETDSSLAIQGFIPFPATLVSVQGNQDLDPVWVTSYEVGYRTLPHPRASASLDVFYSVIEDFKEFTVLSAGPPTVLSWLNRGRTQTYGAELALEFKLYDRLSGFSSYTFQSADGPNEGALPRHRAALGLRGRLLPRLRYALTGVYTGHTDFEASGATPLPEDFIRSHFTVDGFLGLEVTRSFELGFHARDLFHQERRQHPLGDEIGSRLMLSGTLQF
jgi:iron complex outermembrane receptor protein